MGELKVGSALNAMDRLQEIIDRHEFVERNQGMENFINTYPDGIRGDIKYLLDRERVLREALESLIKWYAVAPESSNSDEEELINLDGLVKIAREALGEEGK
jgi:hypothetical protein